MEVSLKACHKNVEINIIGKENEDVVQKLADVLAGIDSKNVLPDTVKKDVINGNGDGNGNGHTIVPSSNGKEPVNGGSTDKSIYENLVELGSDGPVLYKDTLALSKATRVDNQADAVLLIAYVLKKEYSNASPTSKLVSKYVKLSGIDTASIEKAVKKLRDSNMIAKQGKKAMFIVTKAGETQAEKILRDSKVAMG